MKRTLLILIAAVITLNIGCKKFPGEGGKASITGKIWVRDFNDNFTALDAEYFCAECDVYIIYGEDISYGDRIRTDYEGDFEFKYLREGEYQVYTYSKDSTLQSQSGQVTVIFDVVISEKEQVLNIGQFNVYN